MGVRSTAIVGICLLALAGAAFAASSWNAWGWQVIWNGTNTRMSEANGTWNASQSMHRAGNYSQFNSTQAQEFNAAVASGDYATAESLHSSYGLGGSLFGKLNGTTFAQYSQIYNLQNQLKNLTGALRQELGGNAPGQRMAMRGFGFAMGMAQVHARSGMRGFGMMR